MIFSKTLDLLLSGRKTQTRRIARPDESLHGDSVRSSTSGRLIYSVGRTYSVQPGRAQKAVAYILLRGIRVEAVEDISEEDALAEGFDSREAFFATWHAIHGAKANLQQRVWVLTFDLLPLYNKTVEDDPTIGGTTRETFGLSTKRSSRTLRRSDLSIENVDAAIHRKIFTAKDSESPETE